MVEPCGGDVTVAYSCEHDDAAGSGNTESDCTVDVEADEVCLRAERSGGSQRTYTLSVTATSDGGTSTVASAPVRVPASARDAVDCVATSPSGKAKKSTGTLPAVGSAGGSAATSAGLVGGVISAIVAIVLAVVVVLHRRRRPRVVVDEAHAYGDEASEANEAPDAWPEPAENNDEL